MTKRIRPPKKVLVDLYSIQRISPSTIAAMYNVSSGRTVNKWLRYYDIPRTHLNRPKIKPNKDQLIQWYRDEEWSIPRIARYCGVSTPAVREWFVKLGIPRRSNSEAQRLSHGTNKITCALLEQLYLDKEMSQSAIANFLERSQTGIGRLLKSCGIPIRDRANPGERNGMFGRTHTPEAREKIREANRRQFSTKEAREKQAILTARQIEAGKTGKTHNKLETLFASILDSLKIEYIWQYRLGRYVYDFYLPDTNTIIEIHGTFWHADPRFYFHGNLSEIQQKNLVNDKRKSKLARKSGFKFLRFWEHDIHNSTKSVKVSLAAHHSPLPSPSRRR